MDAKKVTQRCDVLRNLVCVGPGDNPAILRKALGIVGSLDGAAKWDYPRQILGDLKERFLDWFSDRTWRGDEAELHRALLRHIDQLPPSWEKPVGD